MFWKKEEEKVKCDVCRHYVDKYECQEVTYRGYHRRNDVEYFCPIHKKPYNSVDVYGHRIFYYRKAECDKDGKIIEKK